MGIKRRWLQSALDETRKPQPKMPWQVRKMVVAMPKAAELVKAGRMASI